MHLRLFYAIKTYLLTYCLFTVIGAFLHSKQKE